MNGSIGSRSGFCFAVLLLTTAARAQVMVPAMGGKIPQHFEVENQYYDLSLRGLRLRVESLKTSDPTTYAMLDSEVTRLEHRRTAAMVLLGGALAAPLVAAGAAAIARSQEECPPMPSPSMANFEQASQTWFQCNEERGSGTMTYMAVGLGVMVIGLAGALVLDPKRSDVLEVVNLHNRLRTEPLRWQFGYDPTRRSASLGAAVSF